ncbi:DUF4157 domain-containing protein, partial [Microcoleus sp. N9_A1]|uniref:DUF4157 domain-containing protein n=1 Tax=Microcoleus sp. N9_A1 TaxID=3055380 RepID=UPI002FD0E4EB
TKPLANSIQREMVPEEKEEEVQTKPLANSIQREMVPEEKEEEVQTKPATEGKSQAGSNLESQLSGTKGGGSALSDEVRSHMEPRFGADFSSVRVHTDSAAVQMNRDLGAQAFTHGSDIYYGGGKSPGKDELTAHELTHVVQQNGGAVQRDPLIQRTGGKQNTDEDDIQSVPAGDIKGKKQTHEDDIQSVPAGDINGKKKQTVETSEVPTDFAHLLKDIDIDKDAKEEIVKKLLSNFYARPDFTYTGESKGGWKHEGDCSTLVSQFIDIAGKYGIKMTRNEQREPLFINGGGKIIDQESKTGNVDSGKHWLFENHVWAEWDGQKIDVLFGQMELKPSQKVQEGRDDTLTVEGTTYYYTKDAVRSRTNKYTIYSEDRFDFANLNCAPRSGPKNRFGTCTIL